jgi:hypothetical protein
MWVPPIKVERVGNFLIVGELVFFNVWLKDWFKANLQIIIIHYGMKKAWWQKKFKVTNIFIIIFLPNFSRRVFQ